MEDKDKLYDYIRDNSEGSQNRTVNIDPKDVTEIQDAPRKIHRLLEELKRENKIAGYEECGDGSVNVEIAAVPPSSVPAGVQIIVPERIHQKVMDSFIGEHIKGMGNDDASLKEYSDLFHFFVRVQPPDSKEEQTGNLFDFVADKINSVHDKNILKMTGPDGTGKSTFLSILYLYLHRLYCTQKLSVYPYYVNLHHYEKRISELQNATEPDNNMVKEWIKEDFEWLEEYADSNADFLIIVDGNDKYSRTNVRLSSNLGKILEKMQKYKKIICISEKMNVHLNKARTSEKGIDYKTAYTFEFSPIFITERDSWKKAIHEFCNIFQCTEQEGTIIKCIDEFHIKEIDYNLLTIFYRVSQQMELGEIHCIHQLYKQYCLHYLNGAEKLADSIHFAYQYFMTGEKILIKDISSKWMEWELVHQHKTISNYLLALYYSNLIEDRKYEKITEFECVFSYGINFFLKSIIRETEGLQENTIEFCKKIFEEGTFKAKSQAAYMVGRITDPNIQEQAKKLLRDQDQLCRPGDAGDEDKRKQYFLKRSILVSRLYLKETAAGEAMLRELFVSPVMSEVNRAFFIQYNADISIGSQTVNFYDSGNNKIPYTIKGLFHYIYKTLEISSSEWNLRDYYQFQIHLFTLCSLIQQRMDPDKKEHRTEIGELMAVIQKIFEDPNKILTDNMMDYLMMLQEDIREGSYYSGHLYKELYMRKQVLDRKDQCQAAEGTTAENGWESIIEHAYYCWLLGMLYLPDNAPEEDEYKGYNKEKILTFFLVRILPELSGKVQGEDEPPPAKADTMHKIFMHSMYADIGNMDGYREIWDDLALNAKDVNGKIASDIDMIEKLYQHHIYEKIVRQSGDDTGNRQKRPQTSVGMKILKEVIIRNWQKD